MAESLMKITIKNLRTNQVLTLPVPPESLDYESSQDFTSIKLVQAGTVEKPSGKQPRRISWGGIHFGKAREDYRWFVWKDPQTIDDMLRAWDENGDILKVTATRTSINGNYRIKTYKSTYKGGAGDIEYSMDFGEATTIAVEVKKKPTMSETRPEPSAATTYTVRPGDSLWVIALRMLKDGGRWREIYNLNKSKIGSDPDILKVGLVLALPER
jgi:LysM repeat protein